MSRPSPQEIVASIRAFLVENAPDRASAIATLDLDAEVWEIFGSLDMLELVEYLEREFSITVHPLEFVPENFSSLKRMVDFTERRLTAPKGS